MVFDKWDPPYRTPSRRSQVVRSYTARRSFLSTWLWQLALVVFPKLRFFSLFLRAQRVMDVQAFLDEDRGPSLLATASVMMILSTIFVGLRFYARYLTSTSFNIQDVIIPFAWLAEIGLCINGISNYAFQYLALLVLIRKQWRSRSPTRDDIWHISLRSTQQRYLSISSAS